jgi:glycosyltransferase involved in cell wall biosynthesis
MVRKSLDTITKQPLVSVIIPAYNRCDLLPQTIESVFAQTYQPIELIVVDDGSTDDTPQVVNNYGDMLISIRQNNQGVAAARNTGIAAASGQFLCFLDQDDLMLPTKIERQIAYYKAHPEVSVVHCGYYQIDKHNQCLDLKIGLPEGDVLADFVLGCPVWSGGPLVRRECIHEVGQFDLGVWCAEADLWMRLALAGYRFGCVQEPLGAYRVLLDSGMANVNGLESTFIPLLDRVFSDHRLPPDVHTKRDEAYHNYLFWLSGCYYATRQWDNANRNLLAALALRPELLQNADELVSLFCERALDIRESNPIGYITAVFEHLPPDIAETLKPMRQCAFGWVYLALAMRSFAQEDIAEAKALFSEAISRDPAIAQKEDELAKLIITNALRLPLVPKTYIDTVLQNIPLERQVIVRLRRHILSEVTIGSAFRDFANGHRQHVPKQVLMSVRYRPSFLLNRGILAILAKSIQYVLKRDGSLPTYHCANAPVRLSLEKMKSCVPNTLGTTE